MLKEYCEFHIYLVVVDENERLLVGLFGDILNYYNISNFTNFTSVMLPTKENPLYTLTEDLIYERYQK